MLMTVAWHTASVITISSLNQCLFDFAFVRPKSTFYFLFMFFFLFPWFITFKLWVRSRRLGAVRSDISLSPDADVVQSWLYGVKDPAYAATCCSGSVIASPITTHSTSPMVGFLYNCRTGSGSNNSALFESVLVKKNIKKRGEETRRALLQFMIELDRKSVV